MKIGTRGQVPSQVIMLGASVVAVWLLTNFGVSKGLPSPISFVVSLAAIFGVLKVIAKL